MDRNAERQTSGGRFVRKHCGVFHCNERKKFRNEKIKLLHRVEINNQGTNLSHGISIKMSAGARNELRNDDNDDVGIVGINRRNIFHRYSGSSARSMIQ